MWRSVLRGDELTKHQGIHLRSVVIENAQMNLVLEDNPEAFKGGKTSIDNLSRIFRIKKPENPKKSEKEIFHIKEVELQLPNTFASVNEKIMIIRIGE